jgi:predicted DNA-binding protein (UPF0251 family)
MRRADHSSRGVLPTVVRRVWYRNLMSEEAIARVGPHRKKNTVSRSYTSNEANVVKAGAKNNAIHARGGSKTHYWSI